ncbi:hypothetical protein FACS1894164_06980 [Spirochaetia bacterium]|nr:hypothetical protein FACS1894164_06980 [Spirochaetia bacterium]
MEERQPTMGLTFEQVWAMFQETDRKFQEMQNEMKESANEMKESAKRLDKKMGDLGLSFGALAEEMVKAGIMEKFNALGFQFAEISPDHVVKDSQGRRLFEIDIMLWDGGAVMAVEVKTKLEQDDVEDHLRRLENMRKQSKGRTWENKKLLGAVAGAVVKKEVRKFALSQGLFLVTQSGDTMQIERPLPVVREW